MPGEDTSNTGGEEAAVDTSNTGDESGEVSDESGGVTPEEIASALGPKYKTVAPVAEETSSEEETAEDVVEETTAEEEAETEEVEEKPVKTEEAAASDEPDFSFEAVDANGVTYKIGPNDKMEDVLADFDPKNNGQLLDVLDKLREAKEAQRDYNKQKNEEAQAASTAERVTAIQDGWNEEIKALQADKRIPTTAKGADNERVAKVYEFMAKRADAGSPISRFSDALDLLEFSEAKEAKVAAEKQAKEDARTKGGLVGGGSAPATSSAPVYKAGSARNPNQALKAMGIL